MKSKLSLSYFTPERERYFPLRMRRLHANWQKVRDRRDRHRRHANGPRSIPGCDSTQTTLYRRFRIDSLIDGAEFACRIKTSKPRTCFYGRRSPTLKSYIETTADDGTRDYYGIIIKHRRNIRTHAPSIPTVFPKKFPLSRSRNNCTVPGFIKSRLRQHAHA